MESKKSIIVYYSRPDFNYGIKERQTIGNTKIVAQILKDLIHADEFELLPKKDYPVDYHECTVYAKDELHKNGRPELKNDTLPDFSKYDVVFFGFPIWWGTFPMVFQTFFDKLPQDAFKGKKIIPFCTHEGSRFERSIDDLEKRVKEKPEHGLAIQGQHAPKSKTQLVPWLQKLGFNVKE